MTRPRKNTVLCRNLAASKQRLPDSEEPSDSDDEAILLGDSQCLDVPSEMVSNLLVWKDGARFPSSSARTGDSRWTHWRKEVKNSADTNR